MGEKEGSGKQQSYPGAIGRVGETWRNTLKLCLFENYGKGDLERSLILGLRVLQISNGCYSKQYYSMSWPSMNSNERFVTLWLSFVNL